MKTKLHSPNQVSSAEHEWISLIQEARNLGVTPEDIRIFLSRATEQDRPNEYRIAVNKF
jgi:DNA-binding transcriptional MerR regulator